MMTMFLVFLILNLDSRSLYEQPKRDNIYIKRWVLVGPKVTRQHIFNKSLLLQGFHKCSFNFLFHFSVLPCSFRLLVGMKMYFSMEYKFFINHLWPDILISFQRFVRPIFWIVFPLLPPYCGSYKRTFRLEFWDLVEHDSY